MQSLVLLNFRLSLVVTLIGCAVILFSNVQDFPDSLPYLGPQAGYTLFAPGVIGALTAVLWLTLYRHGEGHTYAFFIGASLLLPVIGSHISDELIGAYYTNTEQLFLSYTGVSHIAYSLINWQELAKELGSSAD